MSLLYTLVQFFIFLGNVSIANCTYFKSLQKKCRGDKLLCQQLKDGDPFYRTSVFENSYSLMFVLVLGFLFLLLFLGILKGIIGRFHRSIGEFGLHLLIDIPKPLETYVEPELKHRKVVYDVGGWPLHPDYGTRTVRLLARNVEFCLNTIFFIAFPLSLCVQLCSLCCCIRDSDDIEDNAPYKKVNVVKFTNSKSKMNSYIIGTYDNERQEARDTRYVLNELKRSRENLRHCCSNIHNE